MIGVFKGDHEGFEFFFLLVEKGDGREESRLILGDEIRDKEYDIMVQEKYNIQCFPIVPQVLCELLRKRKYFKDLCS